HLARWPGFLALATALLEARADALAAASTAVGVAAEGAAARLAAAIDVRDPAPSRDAMTAALARFTAPALIANYIPKVALLSDALPR
ncbi:MAG: hypothetical protein ACU85V_11370, partial [Gammaproteobacteria bacterium]